MKKCILNGQCPAKATRKVKLPVGTVAIFLKVTLNTKALGIPRRRRS